MTNRSNENDTMRPFDQERWDERWERIEAAKRRSKRNLERLRYWSEMAKRERRWR